MITIEQARRLQKAGWEPETSNMGYDIHGKYDAIYIIDAPDEKEMMLFLQKDSCLEIFNYGKCWQIALGNKVISKHPDLTSALVEACVKVLGKEGK